MRSVFRSLSVLGLFLLGACSSTTMLDVATSQEFPRPLVVPVQAHMGLYIPTDFKNFVYEEYHQKKAVRRSSKEDGSVFKEDTSSGVAKPTQEVDKDAKLKFKVELGGAQTRMVETVIPPVFSEWTMLTSLDRAAMPAGMDLYVVPNISKLQYTTPSSSRAQVYEIWLQYDFTIYDRNGDVITKWVVPSYGKTPTAFMKSKSEALNAATQMALRDCGAAFATGFKTQPSVSRWLQGREARAGLQTTRELTE